MTALPGKPASNSVQSGHDQLLAVSPGERLQRVRKEHTLEISEVAERLNLSPGVVRALEADDYRMLPNATFVKGYLRSYARLLEIKSDDLVRAYEAITGCNQPVKLEPIAAPLIRDSRPGMRNGVLGLGLVLVLAVVAWRILSNDEKPVVDRGAVLTDPAYTQANAPEQSPVNPPVVVTRPPESDAAVVAAGEAVNEPVDEETLPASSASDVPVETQVEPVPDVAPEVAAQVAAAPQVALDPQPSKPVGNGGSGLVNLRFLGECWVEVRDGNGDLVFSSLKRGGEEVNLRATTPINVKLGNGEVVAVQFNHEPVTFTTRPDRKVVRLTLGE